MMSYPNQKTVSTRELSWSKAGTEFESEGRGRLTDGAMTAEEALRLAGLAEWNVRKVPLTTGFSDGPTAVTDSGLIVPGQYATLADINGETTPLGVVGERYVPFQNEETTDLIQGIVDEGGANLVAGGSLLGGRKTFMVMQMPEGITIGGEDAHDMYLGVMNSHDGSGSLVAFVTMVRLACTNMLDSAVKGAVAKFRIRHTSGIHGKVEEARRVLGLSWKWTEEFERQAEELLASPFTNADFDALLEDIEPESDSKHEGWIRRQDDKRDTLRYLFTTAETNAQGRGTKWGAYNAFTEYADWLMPIKGDTDGVKRATRILDAAAVTNYKQRALDALVAA